MTLELSVNNNTLSIEEIIEILRTDFATMLAQDMIIDPNRSRNSVFATNLKFIIPISLPPDGVEL